MLLECRGLQNALNTMLNNTIESYRTDANKSLIKTNKLNLIYRYQYSFAIKRFECAAIAAQIAIEPPLLYPDTQYPESNLAALKQKHELLTSTSQAVLSSDAYELAKTFISRKKTWRDDMVKYYRDDIEHLTPLLVTEQDLVTQLRENITRSFLSKEELKKQFSEILKYWTSCEFKSSWGKKMCQSLDYYSKVQEYANKEEDLFREITKSIRSV